MCLKSLTRCSCRARRRRGLGNGHGNRQQQTRLKRTWSRDGPRDCAILSRGVATEASSYENVVIVDIPPGSDIHRYPSLTRIDTSLNIRRDQQNIQHVQSGFNVMRTRDMSKYCASPNATRCVLVSVASRLKHIVCDPCASPNLTRFS